MFKTKSIYGLFAAVTAVGMVAGCGGGGSNSGAGEGFVPLSGGISTATKTDTPAISATPAGEGTAIGYATTVNGEAKTVYIAASPNAHPAGTPIAVFPDAVPLINATFTRAPGDIVMTAFSENGASEVQTRFTNVVAAQNGQLVLTRPIGLTPGQYFGSVEGPLYFTANGGKTLTVGSIGFMFEVTDDGKCSFPTQISGALPANGGHTGAAGISVTTTSPAGFAGGAAGLILEGDNDFYASTGGFLNAEGKITFKSMQGGFRVPAGGVGSVQFSVYGPVPE